MEFISWCWDVAGTENTQVNVKGSESCHEENNLAGDGDGWRLAFTGRSGNSFLL